MGSNPGLLAFMIPQPVLSISTETASRTQGDLQFAISGVDPQQVYQTSDKLFGHAQAGKLFLPLGGVSNDLSNQPAYNNPTKIRIHILRDQAASYGIGTACRDAAEESNTMNEAITITCGGELWWRLAAAVVCGWVERWRRRRRRGEEWLEVARRRRRRRRRDATGRKMET